MAAAEKLIRVIGPVAVLPLEGGGERYVYKDGVVPVKAVTEDGVKHLVASGLIELVDGSEDSSDEDDNKGDDKPNDKWNNDRITQYAADHSIDLGEAKTKAELLAKIAEHEASQQ